DPDSSTRLPMSDTPVRPHDGPITIPRRLDPEDAQLALQRLQAILKRQEVVEALARRQYESDDRSNLLEGMLHRQHENEIRAIVNELHPSDIAFILESLPENERQAVWQLVDAQHDDNGLIVVGVRARVSSITAM